MPLILILWGRKVITLYQFYEYIVSSNCEYGSFYIFQQKTMARQKMFEITLQAREVSKSIIFPHLIPPLNWTIFATKNLLQE